jgi:hypothetical protein
MAVLMLEVRGNIYGVTIANIKVHFGCCCITRILDSLELFRRAITRRDGI